MGVLNACFTPVVGSMSISDECRQISIPSDVSTWQQWQPIRSLRTFWSHSPSISMVSEGSPITYGPASGTNPPCRAWVLVSWGNMMMIRTGFLHHLRQRLRQVLLLRQVRALVLVLVLGRLHPFLSAILGCWHSICHCIRCP